MAEEIRCRETYSSPGVRGTRTASLLNLEPDSVGARLVGGAVIIGALGHVSDGRADMGLGPQGPEELDVGASCGLGDEGGGGGISVTLDIRGSHIFHGAVAGDLAGDPVRNRTLVWVLVRLIELVVASSDGGVGNVAVSSNEGRGGDEGEGLSGSHFVLMRYSLLVSKGGRKFSVERTIDNG